MPFLGPQKGAILQQLVAEQQPRLAVEVGSMAGYSAIVIAQVCLWLDRTGWHMCLQGVGDTAHRVASAHEGCNRYAARHQPRLHYCMWQAQAQQ